MATILIIDDESGIRYIAKTILSQNPGPEPLTILEASSGSQGLELLTQYHPDLVLLDYRLPDMDGGEWLQQAESLWPTAVLLVSASSELEHIAHQQALIVGTLAKPFKLDKLRITVLDALSRGLRGEVSP
ncbi:two-component system, response regulator, stage 0 sporulation protein F [Sulfobacillus thermosulfidooxidans DSM 9293]|uniref:Stage 0 sporulation protein A homolog n=1 Tax=Sulfobacillus thermosulfidooxidans (strain DSM 9293 / VKM B-1269 / AT-1) TaxID=929705 RepID=A0A1W1WD83_SULTA|nr:response regulator [Sulfobacillus thermosulfidooxidans]SMC04142.1 two-component system, response regulator, stage 0 sporulation protein F [Sulfobacillus thermosulfidooxidans DSM 9293]